MEIDDTNQNRMSAAVRAWMTLQLGKFPGLRESNRKSIEYIFDDEADNYVSEPGFKLPKAMEDQRKLLLGYVRLRVTVDSLSECQYYLRRYPFRDLPVTRSSHVINICEMYFSRCFQFKQQLKAYLNVLETHAPSVFAIGPIMKQFNRAFERELKIRNQIHHHEQFSNTAIERLMLADAAWGENRGEGNCEYRLLTKFWIGEIRDTTCRLEGILEGLAKATLESCTFLSKYNVPPQKLQNEIDKRPLAN